MIIKKTIVPLLALFITLLFTPILCNSATKTIAITIDDLPFVGEARNFHLNMMMDTLVKQGVPATGFIIASEVHKDNWETLNKFKEAGFGLGNHTFSHANLNRLTPKAYIKEISKADKILEPVMTTPKYFRYPYLAMSNGKKRKDILCYLAKKEYTVAPITIDSKDFAFNQRLLSVREINRRDYLKEMKPLYLDFIRDQTLKAEKSMRGPHHKEQAQILLIHANLLNAYVLPDIIDLYREQGYQFVSLDEAINTNQIAMGCKAKAVAKKVEPAHVVEETKPEIAAAENPDQSIENFVQWDAVS